MKGILELQSLAGVFSHVGMKMVVEKKKRSMRQRQNRVTEIGNEDIQIKLKLWVGLYERESKAGWRREKKTERWSGMKRGKVRWGEELSQKKKNVKKVKSCRDVEVSPVTHAGLFQVNKAIFTADQLYHSSPLTAQDSLKKKRRGF